MAHSLSPLMHNTAAQKLGLDLRYYAVELRADELSTVASHLNRDNFKGANITIPYKHILMEYVEELSVVAQKIGAINTIVKENNRLVGENTDIYGFSVPLKEYRDELRNSRAMVFGTGGASKAIIHALVDFGMNEIILVSRSPASNKYFVDLENTHIVGYENWSSYADEAALIVNATPLGMEPDEDDAPIRESEKEYLKDKICYDIVYKPLKTKFLQMAEDAGARTIGGVEMLIYQGSKSFELWTGQSFPISDVRQAIHEEL